MQVPGFLIVVFHSECAQFGEVNAESAAAVVDILAIQRLENKQHTICTGTVLFMLRTRYSMIIHCSSTKLG